MYLDTLKVSTLEQTASQTSAKGGKGNPDLITWDYGKEISLSLEDALFTPASQSLMWGGKFGVKKPKIQGLWNPYIYPKDEYGRTQYLTKKELTPDLSANGQIAFLNGDGDTVATFTPTTMNIPLKLSDGTEVTKYTKNGTNYSMVMTNVPAITDGLVTYVLCCDTSTLAMFNWHQHFVDALGGSGAFYDENNVEVIISEAELGRLIPMSAEGDSICRQGQTDNFWAMLNSNNIVAEGPLVPFIDSTQLVLNPETTAESVVVSFICPCDGSTKYMEYVPAEGEWKYEDITDYAVGYKCPKGYDTGERENSEATTAKIVNTYYWNVGGANSVLAQLKQAEIDNPSKFRGRPERAEIVVDNYGQFDFTLFDMEVLKGTSDGETITLNDQDADSFCIYTPIQSCDDIVGDMSTACGSDVKAYGYEWKKVDMKMTSLEGEQDMYYLENANLRYRVPRNSTQKEIMIAREGLYETVAAVSDADLTELATYEQATATGYEWKKSNDNEITSMTDLTRQNTQSYSYGYFVNPYDASIDFYLNIRITTPQSNVNNSNEHTIRILLGRFFIVADWNFSGDTAYDLTYPIESGMEDVKILERMEKCKATRTFAIDANKNLAMNNYRNMTEYSNSNLTVYIDPKTMKPYEPNTGSFTRANGDVVTGNLRVIKQYEIYYKWTRTVAPDYTSLGNRIIVDAEHFPGTYRVVGETFARARDDGKDQRYQFEIPLAKLAADTNLTLQADGDPTTFTMNFKVLRRDDGVMVKLTQYNVDCNYYDGYASGSTKVVPFDTTDENIDNTLEMTSVASLRLTSPLTQTRNFETNGPDVNVTENLRAVIDSTTTTRQSTFDTTTLEDITTSVDVTNNTVELQPNEFTATVANEEEVGE